MKQKQIWLLVLISLVHFIICIFAGALGWNWQNAIVSIVSAASMYFVYDKVVKKLWIAVLVILPFFLLYIPLSIQSKNYLNYPVWVCGIIVSVITLFLIRFKARLIIFSILLVLLAFLEYFFIYPNYFSYHTSRWDTEKYNLENIMLVDGNNNKIPIEELKGKVVLFDAWHSACYWCIKEFPELQKLYDQYKADSSVKIVSLNYPLKSDKGIKPTQINDKYSFEKMYFLREGEYEDMVGDGVPLVFVMDKNYKCRYAGYLNTDWNIFIGNAKRIINRLKNE